MISLLKIIDTEEKKRLISNIFSLSLLQGANYILPLLTVPYLVRVLGPEYFGLLAFVSATTGYFVLITDYGFNLSATRQIAIHRDDLGKITQIFSAVMIIKTLLMLLSFLLLCMLVISFEKFAQYREVYFITFGMVIGQVLFPVWLFQGMEQMKFITYLNIFAKAIFTICIFIFVKKQSDFVLVPLFTSLGFIISGVWSLYIVKKQFQIKFKLQSFTIIKEQLYDGWHLFMSSMAISFYTISTTFILGLFANNTVVGNFAAANKIVQAVNGLYVPISQAIYPFVSKKVHESKQLGLVFIRKLTLIVGSGMFLSSVLLFFLSEPIVKFLLGNQYQESVLMLQIMAFLPFIIALSNIFGVQTMLSFGYKVAFSRILSVSAFLGAGLSFILVPIYQGLGSSLTVLIVEISVTLAMFAFLKSKFFKL